MTREHLKVLRASEAFDVVGVYSRTAMNASNLASSEGIPYVAANIQDLYESTKAEVVLVCVPEMETEKVCHEIYKYPWYSVIEKPVGYNLEIAERIASECVQMGRNSYVALNRRYFESSLTMINRIENLEGIRYLRIVDQENTEAAVRANQPPEVIENWMFANSIHIIDYIHILLRGRIVDKLVQKKTLGNGAHVVTAQIFFDSGDKVDYTGLWNTPGSWSVNLHIGQIELETRPLEILGVRRLGERTLEEIPLGDDDRIFKPGLKKMWADISNIVEMKPSRMVSVPDSLELMRTIQLIYGDD